MDRADTPDGLQCLDCFDTLDTVRCSAGAAVVVSPWTEFGCFSLPAIISGYLDVPREGHAWF